MTEPVRLSKRMSELGLCSRREADEWIEKGWVRVDGQVVSVLGSKVLPHQKVTVERQASAEQAQRVTILINKPMGYVSGQAEDGYKPAVVLVNEQSRWGRRPDRDALPPAPVEEPGAGRTAGHRLGGPAGADPGWPHRQAVDRRGFGG
ncbi:hypothetical protein J2S30_000599 [Herbaspirillum rubrisubalbicans]|nr:hypothetical protein [Herbaspirillum rubrisubalbicans]